MLDPGKEVGVDNTETLPRVNVDLTAGCRLMSIVESAAGPRGAFSCC